MWVSTTSVTGERRYQEGFVDVTGCFVEDREVQGTLVGSAEVDAVALGAVPFVELLACGEQVRGGRREVRGAVSSAAARSVGEGTTIRPSARRAWWRSPAGTVACFILQPRLGKSGN